LSGVEGSGDRQKNKGGTKTDSCNIRWTRSEKNGENHRHNQPNVTTTAICAKTTSHAGALERPERGAKREREQPKARRGRWARDIKTGSIITDRN